MYHKVLFLTCREKNLSIAERVKMAQMKIGVLEPLHSGRQEICLNRKMLSQNLGIVVSRKVSQVKNGI